MPLQSVDNVHGSDSLPLGVLSVGDCIADDVLQEHLQDTAGLLVDEARDALDTATASQTADGRLGDALDVVPEDLPVAFGSTLSETLASFAAASHLVEFGVVRSSHGRGNSWSLLIADSQRNAFRVKGNNGI